MPLSDVFTTRAQAAEIAWTMACRGNSEVASGLLIPDVEALIDVAVKKTYNDVFKIGEWERLQKVRDSIAIDGTGMALLNSMVIPDSVKPSMKGLVTHSDSTAYPRPFDYVETVAELYLPQKTKRIGYFALAGGNFDAPALILADGNGSPITTGTLTVRACEYFDFENIPSQLRDDFLFVLTEMAKAKFITYLAGGGQSAAISQANTQQNV